ncbi:MAG: hypothetical protein DME26_09675 [Verrucomicrobia bacterium]|nr:MAG: hypothetical protein DME26_09675 [Verrucomicrobiota bacterium]
MLMRLAAVSTSALSTPIPILMVLAEPAPPVRLNPMLATMILVQTRMKEGSGILVLRVHRTACPGEGFQDVKVALSGIISAAQSG